MSDKKIIFVVGPTASGKSNISYKIADNYDAAIVNCDSLQVYKELNIGTAKPSPGELKPYPNYLFNAVELGEEFTAGKFRAQALKVIESTNHELYVFVGGSGFYIHALVNGMFEETPIKKEIQKKVAELKKKLTTHEFYEKLVEVDSEYAKVIHQNDQYRVSRALELVLSLGKSMSQIQTEFSKEKVEFPYPVLYIGASIGRDLLRQRISSRLDDMLKNNFEVEVKNLMQQGYSNWKPMNSVGYREMQSLINGHMTTNEFKDEVVKNTMRLAKRQMTWFKRNQSINWINVNEGVDLDLITNLCRDFLSVS